MNLIITNKDGKVKDFTGIELQTMDTTGTVWPERQRLLNKHGFPVDRADIENKKPFGMNWKMTAKTILIQMHHKSETFEYLNKHLALIIQKPFLTISTANFRFHTYKVQGLVIQFIYTFTISEKRLIG